MSKWTCTRTGELQHHGIKGMKWGRRRFQNADGSLTPAGIKRYRDEAGDIERQLNIGKKETTMEDYEKALDRVKTVSTSVEGVRRTNSDLNQLKDPAMERRIRKNASQMSDKELYEKVQRMNVEDNYTRMMMNRERLERGESFTNKALDVSAVALRGATTALTIALLVKQLRG
jgi:hypothetical protein